MPSMKCQIVSVTVEGRRSRNKTGKEKYEDCIRKCLYNLPFWVEKRRKRKDCSALPDETLGNKREGVATERRKKILSRHVQSRQRKE